VNWTIVNTVALPMSEAAGPREREGTWWHCWSRSPVGALLAATALPILAVSPGGERVLEEQVLQGPTRDSLLRLTRANPPAPAQPGETAPVVGFRFTDYTQDRATVAVVVSFGGKYLVQNHTVQWRDGDWRLDLDPPAGRTAAQTVRSLEGYTSWGAR
jgi:hypothetical protein